MKKLKVGVLYLAIMMVTGISKAQSIEEGVKYMYYEKNKSALSVFDKLIAANPNNTEAIYWKGIILIHKSNRDLILAKELYRKGLEANSNSAILLVGMGHVELHEGKVQDARNRFETAISLTQGKSVPVLNAIGLANGDYDAKNGDAAYAIEKLKQATTLKGFKDASTWCLLGDAYRKFTDGGNAQRSYESALSIDPKYARAKYRIGKIYQTQGKTQEEVYMKYYNEAIALDPEYIPVYYNLYQLFYETDVVKSAQYLEKYLTLKGSDEPDACYYRSTIKYAQGLFAEAINQADGCINSGGENADVRLYGLKGYAYYKLNDSLKAKAAFEQFFQKQSPEKLGPTDFKTYAEILLKFPGNEALAGTFIDKAVLIDTTEVGKVALLKSVAVVNENQKNYLSAADWYKKILNIKKNPSKTDIYHVANNYYRGGSFQAALDGWAIYTNKFPEETYGYYMTALAQGKIDTVMAMGLAVPSYQKVIELGEAQWATDSAKVKAHLLNSYKYLIQYTYNIKRDKKGASDYCTKYLLKEPTDTEVQGFKKIFDAPSTRPATKPATKPVSGTKAVAPAKKPTAKTVKTTSQKKSEV